MRIYVYGYSRNMLYVCASPHVIKTPNQLCLGKVPFEANVKRLTCRSPDVEWCFVPGISNFQIVRNVQLGVCSFIAKLRFAASNCV